jgi:hypothetical protein
MLSCILSDQKMMDFWLAADEMENFAVIHDVSLKPGLIKILPTVLNDLLGKQYYDSFPRTFKDSNGHTIVSMESNILLDDDYVLIGSCSFKRTYSSKSQPTVECASSCKFI